MVWRVVPTPEFCQTSIGHVDIFFREESSRAVLPENGEASASAFFNDRQPDEILKSGFVIGVRAEYVCRYRLMLPG